MSRRLVLALAAALSLTGCSGEVTGVDTPRPVRSTDPDIHPASERAAELVLFVSNQSFEDSTVGITVAVDGIPVVRQDFHVEGQHNWVSFPLAVPPGRHEVTAVSDTGADLSATFAMPRTGKRWAVLDYWFYEDDRRHFEWQVSKRPVAFD